MLGSEHLKFFMLIGIWVPLLHCYFYNLLLVALNCIYILVFICKYTGYLKPKEKMCSFL